MSDYTRSYSVPLTVCAFHLCIVARFDEADVSQVEDACNDVQHLHLDLTWNSNHLHGFLGEKKKRRAQAESQTAPAAEM